MKYLRLIILSVVATFLMSCNNETESMHMLESYEKEHNITIHSQKVSHKKGDIFSVKYDHYNVMYMTSYLIGLTILEDKDAREYFYSLYSENKTNVINLKTLLDESKPFEKIFKAKYLLYNWNLTPKTGGITPPVSVLNPDPLDRPYEPIAMPYEDYSDIIINQNNFGLHIPNKPILLAHDNFSNYLKDKKYVINLWSKGNALYSDGLKMSNSDKNFISKSFDYFSELESLLIIRLINQQL